MEFSTLYVSAYLLSIAGVGKLSSAGKVQLIACFASNVLG